MITIKADGSSKKISGQWMGAYGFVVRKDGWKTDEKKGFLGSGFKNGGTKAEVQAALKALEYIKENYPDEKVVLKTDNSKVYSILHGNPCLDEMLADLEVWKVKRGKVTEADYLCREVWEGHLKPENKLETKDLI